MGKIRNVKPKRINDFKKIKTKVGQTVKRGPTTVISVKTKRIVLLNQINASSEPIVEESGKINQLLRQFHHHSVTHRISALEEMNKILNMSINAKIHIALVLPSVLELLFDDEKETRQILLKLIQNLLEKCPEKETYETIAPIITTYSCSGLTSLSKGIRLDSLHLLNMFLSNESVRTIFHADVAKLLGHIQLVLSAPAQINTSSTFSVAKPLSATSPSTKKSANDTKSESRKKNIPSLFQSSYNLTALYVLSNLLSLLQSISNTDESQSGSGCLNYSSRKLKCDQPVPVDLIIQRPSFRRESLSLPRLSTTSTTSSTQSGHIQLLLSIEETLVSFWKLHSSNQSLLSTSSSSETYSILMTLVSITLPLSSILLNLLSSPSLTLFDQSRLLACHTHIFQEFFHSFPYISEEGVIAPTGSTMELESKKRIEKLNLLLCESAFLGYSSLASRDESNSKNLAVQFQVIQLSSEYLSNSIGNYESKIERQIMYLADATKRILPNSEENDDWEGGSVSASQLPESVLRLFRCLSHHSNYLLQSKIVNDQQSATQFIQFIHQLSSLLNKYHRFLQAYDKKKYQGNFHEISNTFLCIEEVLKSLSQVVTQDELWVENFDPSTPDLLSEQKKNSLLLLVESICHLPPAISGWLGNSVDSTNIFQKIFGSVSDLLHILITRGSVPEIDPHLTETTTSRRQNDVQWRKRINQLISKTIQTIFTKTEKTKSIYQQSQTSVRKTWLDVWSYCRFDESACFDILENVAASVFNLDASADEQIYFSNLLYTRRFDIPPSDFVSLLVNSLESYLILLNNVIQEPTGIKFILSADQSCVTIANLLYISTPSLNSFSIIKLITPVSRDIFLLSESSAYLNSFLKAHSFILLVSKLLRRYQYEESIKAFLVVHSDSDENQTHFTEFLSIAIDSILFLLEDNSSSSQVLLNDGWTQIKHGMEAVLLTNNGWLIQFLHSRWCYASDHQIIDIWSETLSRLHRNMVHKLRAIRQNNSTQSSELLKQFHEHYFSVFNHLFEIIQHWKTIDQFTERKRQSMNEFLISMKMELKDESLQSLVEYLNDIERYMK